MTKTAILVDGAYFLARYRFTYRKKRDPHAVAKDIFTMCLSHACDGNKRDKDKDNLYRIFFYDCPPISKKVCNPISHRTIDFSKTDVFKFRTQLHQELVKLRKVALRLGRVSDAHGGWIFRPRITKALLAGKIKLSSLGEDDVSYSMTQKGVDMRMGLDVASLSIKKMVSQIVLVTGDSDFVPAAKLARREGIDVILDPMWQPINADLYTHIDGLKSYCPKEK